MRQIILQLAVSLDGCIEGPNGEYDWCFTDQDYGMSAFMERVDSVFIGRKSYELLQATGDAGMPGFSALKQYVCSTTLQEVKPGAELLRDGLAGEVARIKKEPGKDIWLFGGASLTASFMDLGLVDEFLLAVHPIILGQGKRLFSNMAGRVPLTLIDTKTYSSGLVMLHYKTTR